MNTEVFEQFQSKEQLREWLLSTGRAGSLAEADKWMKNNVPLEKVYQRKILKYLKELKESGEKMYFWKSQAGPYQKQGLPDVFALIEGKFFAFEVKRPFFGELTGIQSDTITELNVAGGYAFEVSFVSEVKHIINICLRR